MKLRHTFAWLFVLTALVAAYWFTLRGEEERVRVEEEAKRVFEFSPDEVARLRIIRPAEQVIEAVQDAGDWRIVKPMEIAPAERAWDRIASALSELQKERDIEKRELEAYGLAEPGLTIEFQLPDDTAHSLSFGETDPLKKHRYARLDEQNIMLVKAEAFQEFDRRLVDLRNRYLIGEGDEVFERIEFTRLRRTKNRDGQGAPEMDGAVEQTTVALVRNEEDGLWYMDEPVQAIANQSSANKMAEALRYAVGEEYIDSPQALSDYGLGPAGARARVVFAGGGEETVYFGDYSGTGDDRRMYVKQADGPSVFTVEPALAATFPDTPLAFRDNRLLTRGTDGLVSLAYRSADEQFRIALDEETGWQFVEPEDEATDQRTVSGYISYLSEVEAVEYPEEAASNTGLDDPVFTVELGFREGKDPVTLRFGAEGPEASTRYAVQDTGEVVRIRAGSFEALKTSLFNFRDKHLVPFGPEMVQSLHLDLDGETYRFERRDETWFVVAPEGKVWERQSDMDLLLDALVEALALGEERNPQETGYGLEEPALQVSIVPSEGATHSYAIGSVLPGNSALRYAQVSSDTNVLHVEQQVIDDTRAALRGVVDAE